ncbi:MAG: hypothetical protein U9N12_05205 [Euryarchaeota archaeon]|nr:hypothetical protein [Euryarchaeota archaeon]
MPDTEQKARKPQKIQKSDRWKTISAAVILIAAISIMLNIYLCLSNGSGVASNAGNDDETDHFAAPNNTSNENETEMHKIAAVAITPGSTTLID